jgi:hypothetical protein
LRGLGRGPVGSLTPAHKGKAALRGARPASSPSGLPRLKAPETGWRYLKTTAPSLTSTVTLSPSRTAPSRIFTASGSWIIF